MPTTTQSPSKSDFDNNNAQLTEELIQACLTTRMIDSEHVPFLSNLLTALFARDVAALEREMSAYKDTPEDAYLPLQAVSQLWANAMNDHSMQATCDGLLALSALLKPEQDKKAIYSGFTREITYRLELFTDKPAEGYKSYRDDTLVSNYDRRSRVISAQEALDEMMPLFNANYIGKLLCLPRNQDKMSFIFGITPGRTSFNDTLNNRQTVHFAKGLRAFVSQREAAKKRGKLAYWTWRWQNRRDVKRYEREIRARIKNEMA